MKILILTGGRIERDFALRFFREEQFSHIIVVDGALAFWDSCVKADKTLQDAGLPFDYLVGDFDTVSPDILEKYLHDPRITVHRFKAEKDDTDTDIAVKLAIDLVKSSCEVNKGEGICALVTLLGATGTRMDHTLSSMMLLRKFTDAGIPAFIVDSHNRIRLIGPGITRITKKESFGGYLSLLPAGDKIGGLRLSGLKYPLPGTDVLFGDSLCVSNEITEDEAVIEIGDGYAFVIESKD